MGRGENFLERQSHTGSHGQRPWFHTLMTVSLITPAASEDHDRRSAPSAQFSRNFSDRWLLLFVSMGFLFELGLWFAGDTALRLPLRIGMYVMSLAFVFF